MDVVRHQKKCKTCGAPEEYIEDVEYRHKGQTAKTPICSVCGIYAGPKLSKPWLKPTIMAKSEKYLKIKEEQTRIIKRAIELLDIGCTDSRVLRDLSIPFAYPKDGSRA